MFAAGHDRTLAWVRPQFEPLQPGAGTVLTITSDAIEAIKAVMGHKDGGLRITAASESMNGDGLGLSLEPVPEPEPDDAVMDADGAHLYLDPLAAGLLDGKVLDAEQEGEAVRFSIVEPG
jgi:iron-sulfur cluster assembly protein